MDRETFAKGMFILQAAYEKQLDQDTMEVYFSFLNHLTPAQLERAARQHIAKSGWFPKISELLGAVKNDLPTPIDVWNRLLAAAADGTKPEMDAATERALASIGGWDQFQYIDQDSLRFRFKDFKEALLEGRDREGTVPEIESGGSPIRQIEH